MTEIQNPLLTALMAEPGPNPVREAFSSVERNSFGFVYAPGPISRVMEILEELLKKPHTNSMPLYFNQGSDELRMLAELFQLNRSTARQLALAMKQQPVLEVDIQHMRHYVAFRRLEP